MLRLSSISVAIIIFVAALGSISCRRIAIPEDVAAIYRDIKNNLPVGLTREQVKAFLDERKIPHSAIGEMPASPELKNTEVASIRAKEGSDIQIVFHFDHSGTKLSGIMLKALYARPPIPDR